MDIKKADNKGRISGFTPHSYYRVNHSGTGWKVDQLLIEQAIEEGGDVLNESGITYLNSFGLDHMHILREECTRDGYWERGVGENGKVIFEYGAVKKTRKPWPVGFDYEVFASKALMLE